MKLNCWEHKKCGRQPGGQKAQELGICPVTTYQQLDGAHDGRNAGRACWAIAGSLCGGTIQGTYAQKLHNCWRCLTDGFHSVPDVSEIRILSIPVEFVPERIP